MGYTWIPEYLGIHTWVAGYSIPGYLGISYLGGRVFHTWLARYFIPGYLSLTCQDVCCEFLKRQLDPSNCLGIRAFADTHACRELLRIADKFTQHNFQEVSTLIT